MTSRSKSAFFLTMATAALAFSSSPSQADSVILDTGYDGPSTTIPIGAWTVTRAPSAGSTDHTVVTNTPVAVVSTLPGYMNNGPPGAGTWIRPGEPIPGSAAVSVDAQWVSWNSNTGVGYTSDADGTEYQFVDTFQLDTLNASNFSFAATMASDNALESVSLTYNTSSTKLAGINTMLSPGLDYSEYDYDHTFTATASLSKIPAAYQPETTFYLTIDLVNSYQNPIVGESSGPTGLLLSGNATISTPLAGKPASGRSNAVPLPESAGVGFSMLGGLGILAAVRKRRRHLPLIG